MALYGEVYIAGIHAEIELQIVKKGKKLIIFLDSFTGGRYNLYGGKKRIIKTSKEGGKR